MRFLVGFFRKLWHGLDIFRRVLHLVLLLFLLALVIGALRESIPRLPERGALVVRPSGDLVEQLSGRPLERALSQAQGQAEPQTLLWDLTDGIRAAAKDARIQALLIDTDDLGSAGQAKLEELAAAIAEFRAAGKKVIARGSDFEQSQYYLAAQADEIYLDPFGRLLLQGYGRYRMYYKDALDKLAVDVHLYRAGKYKSAAETYVRRDMSPEERAESEAYINSLWRGYRTAVAGAQRRQPEELASYAEQFSERLKAAGGNAAQVAKAAGLITDIKTAAQVDARMVQLVGADSGADDPDAFRAVAFDDYLRVMRAEDRLRRRPRPTIAVVVASGEIVDGEQPPGTVGGKSTAALLRQARFDNDVRAVVLRIDSPGGSVFASEEIYREVRALRAAGKSVVASMSDLAASGGYYIAAPANEIIASGNTITGSIGAYGALPTFSRSLDKLGINVDGVGTAPLSGALRLDRPMQPALDALLGGSIQYVYQEFLGRVADGRGKTREEIDAIAQGRVWAGVDAQRLGLVDRLGNYEDALQAAARLAKLGADYRVRRIEPKLTLAEQLLFQMRGTTARLLRASGLLSSPALRWAQRLQPLERELGRIDRYARSGSAFTYCFCAVE
jgi:protease-4